MYLQKDISHTIAFHVGITSALRIKGFLSPVVDSGDWVAVRMGYLGPTSPNPGPKTLLQVVIQIENFIFFILLRLGWLVVN